MVEALPRNLQLNKKIITLQNLELASKEKSNLIGNEEDQSLIHSIISQSENHPVEIVKKTNTGPSQRNLFFGKISGFFKKIKWGRKKKKKSKKRRGMMKMLKAMLGSRAAAKMQQMKKKAFKFRPFAKPAKKIPVFKRRKWMPKVTLPNPRISLRSFRRSYCPCKRTKGTCNCAKQETSRKRGFADVTPYGAQLFKTEKGSDWYGKQANMFRQYKMVQSSLRKKKVRQIQREFTKNFETSQIEAWTKHLLDLHNISAQLMVQKKRLRKIAKRSIRYLETRSRLLTSKAIIAAIKLSTAKCMVLFSYKYPAFLEAITEEIAKWKEFIIEKHEILYDEHQEKVDEYYKELEKKKKLMIEVDEKQLKLIEDSATEINFGKMEKPSRNKKPGTK